MFVFDQTLRILQGQHKKGGINFLIDSIYPMKKKKLTEIQFFPTLWTPQTSIVPVGYFRRVLF